MIKFGPAGNESSFYDEGYKHTYQAMKWIADKGLNAYEYQSGRGVRMGAETAAKIKEQAEEHNIALSLHAPYFINPATFEKEKIESSLRHMHASYEASILLGAKRVVVHTGAFKGSTREAAIVQAQDFFKNFLDDINDESITFCPELMGKINQLGNLEEVIQLCKNDERLLPVIDFGHLNARTAGLLKSSEDYERVIIQIMDGIGIERTRRMHIHFSQIEYTKGGEKKHLTYEDNEYGPFFKDLVPVLYKYDMHPIVICESSDKMAEDALKSKLMYEEYGDKL